MAVEELTWGLPLGNFPRVFPSSAARGQDSDAVADPARSTSTAAARPYDIIIGADLLYNPALYRFLLPTVLRLLAIAPPAEEEEAAKVAEAEPQLGSARAVVYMCYMERGGEEAFFGGAAARGVLCDRPTLLAPLAALGEELGCVVVRMRNGKGHERCR